MAVAARPRQRTTTTMTRQFLPPCRIRQIRALRYSKTKTWSTPLQRRRRRTCGKEEDLSFRTVRLPVGRSAFDSRDKRVRVLRRHPRAFVWNITFPAACSKPVIRIRAWHIRVQLVMLIYPTMTMDVNSWLVSKWLGILGICSRLGDPSRPGWTIKFVGRQFRTKQASKEDRLDFQIPNTFQKQISNSTSWVSPRRINVLRSWRLLPTELRQPCHLR